MELSTSNSMGKSDEQEYPSSNEVIPRIEVMYQDGATPLFLAIEETRWRDALDIAETAPEQIKVWVRSMGDSASMNWSLWCRLPIHEACRRQAPAWMVSTLLSSYPESAAEFTHFGQLPLHLAVECGASPEVVNLLVVAYWDGIVANDQSGRTPVEILNCNELLEQDDHRVVFESLTRCHKAYTDFQKKALEEQNAIKKKNMATFSAVKRRHEGELKEEHEKQDRLQEEIRFLEAKIEDLKREIELRDEKIGTFNAEERKWMDRVKDLANTVSSLRNDLKEEKDNVEALLNTIEEKDNELMDQNTVIQTLSADLQNVVAHQEEEIASSLLETERSMRKMVSNQIALQKQVTGQTKGLKRLLEKRGISMPSTPDKLSDKLLQEEKCGNGPEEDMDTGDAASAVMAAATAALQSPPTATAV